MNKPATISRRGFLQSLGLMATTVLLGDGLSVVAPPKEIVQSTLSFIIRDWQLKPRRVDIVMSEMSEFAKVMADMMVPAEVELLGPYEPSRMFQGSKGIATIKGASK